MNRKKFIKIGIASSTGLLLGGCKNEEKAQVNSTNIATSKKKYKWRMVTTWPPHFPVLGEGAELFAKIVNDMSSGQLEIDVKGAGEIVPALEAFDAVRNGVAEMGSGAAYYWAGKMPAAQFFSAVPFGMNARQSTAWILQGGGMELWEELYSPFGVKPFIAGNTGIQMGGWFNKEINSPNDLRGLKMRIPGLGGKVLKKAGGSAVLVPAGEIYTSLDKNVIDATEWIGPYHDYKMGFYKIAKYYYYPGWHEPGTLLEFIVNKNEFEKLPNELKEIIKYASESVHNWVLSKFDSENGIYLDKLINEENVELRKFSDSTLDYLRQLSKIVIQEVVDEDPSSKKVFESYEQFRRKTDPWFNISEGAYYSSLK